MALENKRSIFQSLFLFPKCSWDTIACRYMSANAATELTVIALNCHRHRLDFQIHFDFQFL